MDPVLLAAAGVVTVSAITPGPNNVVVMRAAACSGLGAALPVIAAIVAGGLAVLLLAWAGADAAFAQAPHLYRLVAMVGAAYLCWLGIGLMTDRTPRTGTESAGGIALPSGPVGLFAFQFFNPKCWVMVLTVTAATRGGGDPSQALLALAVMFTAIPAACLALWSVLGAWLARRLQRPELRRRLDRAMGGLLLASALVLVVSAEPAPRPGPGDAGDLHFHQGP